MIARHRLMGGWNYDSIYINPPTSKTSTYDGTPKELINKGSAGIGYLEYSLDGETWSTESPTSTNAGIYEVYYHLVIPNAQDFVAPAIPFYCSIDKAEGYITTQATAISSLTYTGSSQYLVTAASGSGTIEYSKDGGSTWSTTRSKGTNAGDYTVLYRAKESTNYTASEIYTVSVSIAKASITSDDYTAPAKRTITYTGSSQYLITTGSTTVGTIQYSTDNSTWSTTRPKGTNAGSYDVWWKIVGDSNHKNKSSAKISGVSISKAAGSVKTAPTGNTLDYTGSSQYLCTAGASDTGTMYYRVGTSGSFSTTRPKKTAVGTYTVYYYAAESDNYEQSATASVTAEIKYTYNGHEYVDLGLPSGTLWAKTNVGASNSYNIGKYYKYGLTSAYSNSQTNYTGTENPLSTSKDVAYQSWGSKWRIPTSTQWEELKDNCTLSLVTVSSQLCLRCTSNINSNYINIPISGGYYEDGSFVDASSSDDRSFYWTCIPSGSSEACYARIRNATINIYTATRKDGFLIRPVAK